MSTNTITLGPQVQTQPSSDDQANVVYTQPNNKIYNMTINSNYSWFSSPNQEFILTLQDDGNLVLYRVIGTTPLKEGAKITVKKLWDTNTAGNPGDLLKVQGDGNLVMYPKNWPTKPGLWSWPNWTYKASNANLYLYNTGALTLYNGNTSVWPISPSQD